jgi:chorismate mutase
MIRGIRGAITIAEDKAEYVWEETCKRSGQTK